MNHTIRYDTRCYFNVRSKADMSQLNLPHGTATTKKCKTEKLKSKKTGMLRSKLWIRHCFGLKFQVTGNESLPKIIINDTMTFFLKLQSAFWWLQTITVSECCSIKLLPYILFENYNKSLALDLASPWNRHCANCIGTLSFPHYCRALVDTADGVTAQSCPWVHFVWPNPTQPIS